MFSRNPFSNRSDIVKSRCDLRHIDLLLSSRAGFGRGRRGYRERAALSAPRQSFLPLNAGLEGPLFHGGGRGRFKYVRSGTRCCMEYGERAALSAPRKLFLPLNAGWKARSFTVVDAADLST